MGGPVLDPPMKKRGENGSNLIHAIQFSDPTTIESSLNSQFAREGEGMEHWAAVDQHGLVQRLQPHSLPSGAQLIPVLVQRLQFLGL